MACLIHNKKAKNTKLILVVQHLQKGLKFTRFSLTIPLVGVQQQSCRPQSRHWASEHAVDHI